MPGSKSMTGAFLTLVLAWPVAAGSLDDILAAFDVAMIGFGCVAVVLSILIPAFWLWLAARMTNLHGTLWTAIGAVLLISVLSLVVNILIGGFVAARPTWQTLAVVNVLTIPVAALGVRFAYSTTYLHALLAYVASFLLSVVSAFLVALAVFGVAMATGADAEFKEAVKTAWNEANGIPSEENSDLSEENSDLSEENSHHELTRISSADREPEFETVRRPLAEARKHKGETVWLALTNGDIVSGILEKVDSKSLSVRQKLSGGYVTIPVQKAMIQEFKLKKVGAAQ